MTRSGVLHAVAAAFGGVVGVVLARAALRPRRPGAGAPYDEDVAPAIAALLRQIDDGYPARSRASDGVLPSAAHHARNPSSDHERGDALDVTFDPMQGPNMDELAEALLADGRAKYVIWNERIANPSIDGGAWRPYVRTDVQSDPHTSHLHVSILRGERGDASPWRIEDGSYGTPPAGYAHMPQARVTPERSAWAKALLADRTFGIGNVRTKNLGRQTILARAEIHPPSASIARRHRGSTLYEPLDRPS